LHSITVSCNIMQPVAWIIPEPQELSREIFLSREE
jgi:hypothetical protein